MNGHISTGSGSGYQREVFGYPDGCKDCVCNDFDDPKIIHAKDCTAVGDPFSRGCECNYCECACHIDPDDFMFDDDDGYGYSFDDEDF